MASDSPEIEERLQLSSEQRALLEIYKLPQWPEIKAILAERARGYERGLNTPLHRFLLTNPGSDHVTYLAAQSFDQGRHEEVLSLVAGIEEAKEAYDTLASAERELLTSKDQ